MIKIMCQPCGGSADWPCDDPNFVHNTILDSQGAETECPCDSLTSHHSRLWFAADPKQNFVTLFAGHGDSVTDKYFCVPPEFCTGEHTIHIHAVIWRERWDIFSFRPDRLILEMSCAGEASSRFIKLYSRVKGFGTKVDPETGEAFLGTNLLKSCPYEELECRKVREIYERLYPAEAEHSEATGVKRAVFRRKGDARLEKRQQKKEAQGKDQKH